MTKKKQNIISIYLRPDEIEYVEQRCEKLDKSKSSFIRALINGERFGTSQLELNLNITKDSLPQLIRKVQELDKRLKDVEKTVDNNIVLLK